jgi:hypothetical protein
MVIELDHQQLWALLKKRFTYDRNNHRPRYLGVRTRINTAALRVVGG